MASATADAELLEKDLADPHAAKPASAKKTGKRAAQRSWLGAASHYASSVASGASSLYTNSAPVSANRADSLYLSWAADASWAIATTALLLAIPIVVEIQRETTVRVMQHQREVETQQIQEQARQAQGGILQQAQAFGALLTGTAPGGPPA